MDLILRVVCVLALTANMSGFLMADQEEGVLFQAVIKCQLEGDKQREAAKKITNGREKAICDIFKTFAICVRQAYGKQPSVADIQTFEAMLKNSELEQNVNCNIDLYAIAKGQNETAQSSTLECLSSANRTIQEVLDAREIFHNKICNILRDYTKCITKLKNRQPFSEEKHNFQLLREAGNIKAGEMGHSTHDKQCEDETEEVTSTTKSAHRKEMGTTAPNTQESLEEANRNKNGVMSISLSVRSWFYLLLFSGATLSHHLVIYN